MCYVNNTIGNIQKIFHVVVQYSPKFIENDKVEQHYSTKMHHGINLNCKVSGSPEPKVKWIFVSLIYLFEQSQLIANFQTYIELN